MSESDHRPAADAGRSTVALASIGAITILVMLLALTIFVDFQPDDSADSPTAVTAPVAETPAAGQVSVSRTFNDTGLVSVMNRVQGFIAEAERYARTTPGYQVTPDQLDANARMHSILGAYAQGHNDAAVSQLAAFSDRFPTHPLSVQWVELGY